MTLALRRSRVRATDGPNGVAADSLDEAKTAAPR